MQNRRRRRAGRRSHGTRHVLGVTLFTSDATHRAGFIMLGATRARRGAGSGFHAGRVMFKE